MYNLLFESFDVALTENIQTEHRFNISNTVRIITRNIRRSGDSHTRLHSVSEFVAEQIATKFTITRH